MQYISATEAKQRFAALMDAAQSEPIVIQRQNRDVAVMISVKEYDKLRGHLIEEFEQLCDEMAAEAVANGMTDEIMADLLKD